jgi:hypothetical protein
MAGINVPKPLPNCELIRELMRKCEKRNDIELDLMGELLRFQKRVTEELRFVNALFPEYIPHDEQYHVKNLFHIADQLLGKNLINDMNSGELFVLACSLYGHDWGMAVSEREKRYIIEGSLAGDENTNEIWILDGERRLFERFISERGLTIETRSLLEESGIEIWREYVRHTHHLRSGERVRRYFEAIGLGVPEAIARTCESHGLNCVVLTDPDSFPTDFSVIREIVNLRAIAIYVRLIDMFDLGDDRTPFVIWKFVWPRNIKSVMEWEKHRALQPATFPEYLGGRIIQVDGSTADQEVYAALEDLRRYCEIEFRECCDILARMNDARHQLNISHIRWRVMPRGFKPISIQFEFDRERMFDILGKDIYKGNPYVFLRELLQNSIDAIRVRRNIFWRRGIEPPVNIGLIQVNVEDKEDGNKVITWKDDGCGMDEDIVRKYLAVAGKSYYYSLEFEKTGIELEPISLFGIGILSCFIVADRIAIETYKEPYLPPASKPLRIEIPATNRQFRIQEINEEAAEVGTTVQVFIERRKFENENLSEKEKLSITEYLCEIAGFVEFPIAINENCKKTLILHPYRDPNSIQANFGKRFDDYDVRQMNLEYPWPEVVAAHDIETAKTILKEERFDLKKDLNLTEYEGVLIYPVPASYDFDFGYDTNELVMLGSEEEPEEKVIRWLGRPRGMIVVTSSSFWITEPEYLTSDAIYRDGILVPKASFICKDLIRSSSHGNPARPLMIVNLPKSRTKMIDVARTEILGKSNEWAKPLFDAWINKLADRYQDYFLELEPLKRLLDMINFCIFQYVPFSRLEEIVPSDSWPILFLEREGHIVVKLFKEVKHNEILTCPHPLQRMMAKNLVGLFHKEKVEGVMEKWEGGPCLVDYATWSRRSERIVLFEILRYFDWILSHYYSFKGIRFLSAPWDGDPPLVQEIWEPMENQEKDDADLTKDDFEKVMNNPKIVDTARYRTKYIGSVLGRPFPRYYDFIRIASFPPPYKKYFAYGNQFLNIEHTAVQAILKLSARYTIASINGSLDKIQQQNISHALFSMFTEMPGSTRSTYEKWANIVNELKLLINQTGFIDEPEMKSLIVPKSSFVPGSLNNFLDLKVNENWEKPFGAML